MVVSHQAPDLNRLPVAHPRDETSTLCQSRTLAVGRWKDAEMIARREPPDQAQVVATEPHDVASGFRARRRFGVSSATA